MATNTLATRRDQPNKKTKKNCQKEKPAMGSGGSGRREGKALRKKNTGWSPRRRKEERRTTSIPVLEEEVTRRMPGTEEKIAGVTPREEKGEETCKASKIRTSGKGKGSLYLLERRCVQKKKKKVARVKGEKSLPSTGYFYSERLVGETGKDKTAYKESKRIKLHIKKCYGKINGGQPACRRKTGREDCLARRIKEEGKDLKSVRKTQRGRDRREREEKSASGKDVQGGSVTQDTKKRSRAPITVGREKVMKTQDEVARAKEKGNSSTDQKSLPIHLQGTGEGEDDKLLQKRRDEH